MAARVASLRRDYGVVILAAVLWGTSFPGSELTVGAVDPLFLTFARLGIGGLLGFAVLSLLGRFDARVFRSPYVWVLGALNAIAFDLQNSGIALTTASKTSLLVNVNVVFIAILMSLVFKERMTGPKVLGIVVGVGGVVLLATRLDPSSLAGGEFRGDVLVFLSGLVWAFFVIGTKEMVDLGGDYVAEVTAVLAVTSLYAAIPLFFLGTPLPATTEGWLGIAYLGLVPTFTPMILYASSMRTISPTISALLILLEVILASVLSFLFLGDLISVYTLAGGALILFGAWIVARGQKEIPEPGAAGLAPVPADTVLPPPERLTRR